MDLAQFFQLGLLAFGLVHVDRVIEENHQVVGDLAELGYLQSHLERCETFMHRLIVVGYHAYCSSPRRLCVRLAEAGISICRPDISVLYWENLEFADCDTGSGKLWYASKVVRPAS